MTPSGPPRSRRCARSSTQPRPTRRERVLHRFLRARGPGLLLDFRHAVRAGRGNLDLSRPGASGPPSCRCRTPRRGRRGIARPHADDGWSSTAGCSGIAHEQTATDQRQVKDHLGCPWGSFTTHRGRPPRRAPTPGAWADAPARARSPSVPRRTRTTSSARTGARPPLAPRPPFEELGYASCRTCFALSLRHAGGIRIDHVITWVCVVVGPERPDVKPGGHSYVRYDHEALIVPSWCS